jgi:CubicO group peptidase (beta-lactamase class C family)
MQFMNFSRLAALFFALLVIFGPVEVAAQKKKTTVDPTQALAAQIEASFNTFKPTGLSVAIVKDGQVVLHKALGLANAETNEPATTASLFNIASCSKAFTAAAIGLLVEEGKLRWEDKVIDFLPGFALSDPWVTAQFTIRDLLCHRSGLGTFDGDLLWYGSHYTDEQILAHVRYLPLRQEFRTDFGYQNNMYVFLGRSICRRPARATMSSRPTPRWHAGILTGK